MWRRSRRAICSSSAGRWACRFSSCSRTAASPRRARRSEQPIALVESGPAAGAMGAAFLARQAGWDDVIAFDMGGTTAKVSLIHGGMPHRTHELEAARLQRFKKGSGLPLRLPVIELIEIGAGGGSIAGDRRARPAARGPAELRRGAGPCLLWPRRRGSDGDRRRSRSAAIWRRTASSADGCGSTARGRRGLWSGLGERLGLDLTQTANGRRPRRRQQHGDRRPRPYRGIRHRSAALQDGRVRRRRSRARL